MEESEITHLLGEIGIAFLLFIIGLEFSLPQFWRMRRTLLGLGGIQVLAGTVSGAFIAWLIGIQWSSALIVGGTLAMSSTAIVITTKRANGTTQPLRAFSVRHFIIPRFSRCCLFGDDLSTHEQSLGLELSYALFKALLAFAIVLAAGRWLLRPLFHKIASARSAELFTLTALLVSLLAAWLTQVMGLSLALGAFLAGMMLSETEYRHQIEAELRPFRDILLGLFFITVGMQLNLTVLLALWPWVLLSLGLVLGKGILITLLAWLGKADKSTALSIGLVLGHGGEFGFALLALALSSGLLLAADSQAILGAII